MAKSEKSTTALIRDWALARGLDTAAPEKQMLKLMEEVGELAQGLAKDRPGQVRDSLGDTYVVLTILALQLDLNIEDCIADAYQVIAERKGTMHNGVFIKAADIEDVGDEQTERIDDATK